MDLMLRFVLTHLVVALVAIGLASVPLHAAARMADAGPGPSTHGVEVTPSAHSYPDHRHDVLAKSHAAGQACCHPGCIMAVVPVFAGATQGSPLSEVVPIPPDLIPVPAMLSGIDCPPKRA